MIGERMGLVGTSSPVCFLPRLFLVRVLLRSRSDLLALFWGVEGLTLELTPQFGDWLSISAGTGSGVLMPLESRFDELLAFAGTESDELLLRRELQFLA